MFDPERGEGIEHRVDISFPNRRVLQDKTVRGMLKKYRDGEEAQRSRRTGGVGAKGAEIRKLVKRLLELVNSVTTGVEGADKSSHARADDEVGADARTLNRADYPDMRKSTRATSGKHEGGAVGLAGLACCGRGCDGCNECHCGFNRSWQH